MASPERERKGLLALRAPGDSGESRGRGLGVGAVTSGSPRHGAILFPRRVTRTRWFGRSVFPVGPPLPAVGVEGSGERAVATVRPATRRAAASKKARIAPAAGPAARLLDIDATIAQVGQMLRDRGERMTGPRRAVLTVLARDSEHLSADAVLDRVADQDPSVHRASVYRTLEALSDLGVVQHVHVGHGRTAYHLVRGERAHPHAQCRVCGTVYDLPADLLDAVSATLARRHKFRLDAGHVAMSGVCADCADVD